MIIVANAFLFNDDWTDFTFLWYFCFRKVIGLVLTHTLEEKNTTKSGYKAPTPIVNQYQQFQNVGWKATKRSVKKVFFPTSFANEKCTKHNHVLKRLKLFCTVGHSLQNSSACMHYDFTVYHFAHGPLLLFPSNYILNVFQDLQVLSSSKCHDDI